MWLDFYLALCKFFGNTPVIPKPEYLIEEVADVIGGELLGPQQLVQVALHQALVGDRDDDTCEVQKMKLSEM